MVITSGFSAGFWSVVDGSLPVYGLERVPVCEQKRVPGMESLPLILDWRFCLVLDWRIFRFERNRPLCSEQESLV